MNKILYTKHGIVHAGFSGFRAFVARKKMVQLDRKKLRNPARHHSLNVSANAMKIKILHRISIFLGLSILIITCKNLEKDDKYNIYDFVTKTNNLIDTSQIISRENLINDFELIPVDFGYALFENIIDAIPTDSSIFKQKWNWTIDTINAVLVEKTNLRLDPNKKLSNDTYFFVIYFNTQNKLSIAATIYTDFKRNLIGTYTLNDTFRFAELDNDEYFFADLKKQLSIPIE